MKILKTSTVLALAALAGWFVLLRPVALGGPAAYEIVSGTSMEPGLHAGDLVVTQAQSSYAIGEVVVFRVPRDEQGAGSLVVHRLVGGNGEGGFVTQGDNKPTPDLWHPKSSDIIGRSWIALPGSGKVLLLFRQPLVLAALLGGLAGFWIFTSGSGTSSTTKRGLAGGLTEWIRGRSRHLSKAAASSGHPVASQTPVKDMRKRNAQTLARR
jgi:signal peptidase I